MHAVVCLNVIGKKRWFGNTTARDTTHIVRTTDRSRSDSTALPQHPCLYQGWSPLTASSFASLTFNRIEGDSFPGNWYFPHCQGATSVTATEHLLGMLSTKVIQAEQTLFSKLLMKVPSEGGAEQCVEDGEGGSWHDMHADRNGGEKERGWKRQAG